MKSKLASRSGSFTLYLFFFFQIAFVTAYSQTINVNGQGKFSKDLFSAKLHFDTDINGISSTRKYNGSPSIIEWRVGGNDKQLYNYSYDDLDQLKRAEHNKFNGTHYTSSGLYDLKSIDYDLNGNIKNLSRVGKLPQSILDDLKYSYNNENQLINLEELGDQIGGFTTNKSSAGYQYDQNGNMIRDDHKNMDVFYNARNLPCLFVFDNADTIKVRYNAEGKKMLKITADHYGNAVYKNYSDDFEYLNGVLESIQHMEGRTVSLGSNYQNEFTIKDHIGNSRVNFADLNSDGKIQSGSEVLQENHYYPFGLVMEGNWNQVSGLENNYQYSGKELNSDFGLDWLDYHARWYDPAIG
ncbi:MAG: hypothetical protein MRY83_17315, partial [Flavobacteriales bacterium]|nr:hypothetical protein [Flavobacteriales bacterium]